MANGHPYYDVYVSESKITFWKIVMEGVISHILTLLNGNSPQRVSILGAYFYYI